MKLLDYLDNNNLSKANYKSIDKKGFTCIDRAVNNAHLEMVQKLVKIFNIDLQFSNFLVRRLIFRILSSSHIDSLKLLDWYFENVKGISEDVVDNFYLLLWIGGKNSELIVAKIKFLLNRGGNLALQDGNGHNLLMYYHRYFFYSAIDENLIKFMISNGFNIDQKNIWEQNICHIIAKYGNLNLLKNCFKIYLRHSFESERLLWLFAT